jgi:hypothetical protein
VHGTAASVGAAVAAAHHAGGAYGTSLLHAAASAFVAGADRAVLAGAIAALAGLVIAFRTLRVARPSPPQAPAKVEAQQPAGTKALAGAVRG